MDNYYNNDHGDDCHDSRSEEAEELIHDSSSREVYSISEDDSFEDIPLEVCYYCNCMM